MSNNYVVCKTLGGLYAALVKNKKYGDGGNTNYTTNPKLEGVSTFPSEEKAEACIAAIKKRRNHIYDFVVMTIDEAKMKLQSSSGFCIGKIISGNYVQYYLSNKTFGEIEDSRIKVFPTEEEAENKKNDLKKYYPDAKLLVLDYVLPDD